MAYVLDGISMDVPLKDQQIIELARKHRRQLHEALFHQEIHMGNYAFVLRNHVYDFIGKLTVDEQQKFCKVYDAELKRGAQHDDLHPAYAEEKVSVFTAIIALFIIFIVLYFTVIRMMIA